LGQGRENAKVFLIENPEIMMEISERIRQQIKPKETAPASETADDPDDKPISID
jgi:recombination protein RecA